jgi:nucleoside 2-deoxyribosyltransferase
MHYYLAGRVTNSDQINGLINAFNKLGWTNTFNWTKEPSLRAMLQDGFLTLEYRVAAAHTSEAEIDAVKRADILIVKAPGGRGTHVEIGAALAMNKPVLLWFEKSEEPYGPTTKPEYPCAFYSHRLVHQIVGADSPEMFEKVVAEAKALV